MNKKKMRLKKFQMFVKFIFRERMQFIERTCTRGKQEMEMARSILVFLLTMQKKEKKNLEVFNF